MNFTSVFQSPPPLLCRTGWLFEGNNQLSCLISYPWRLSSLCLQPMWRLTWALSRCICVSFETCEMVVTSWLPSALFTVISFALEKYQEWTYLLEWRWEPTKSPCTGFQVWEVKSHLGLIILEKTIDSWLLLSHSPCDRSYFLVGYCSSESSNTSGLTTFVVLSLFSFASE